MFGYMHTLWGRTAERESRASSGSTARQYFSGQLSHCQQPHLEVAICRLLKAAVMLSLQMSAFSSNVFSTVPISYLLLLREEDVYAE